MEKKYSTKKVNVKIFSGFGKTLLLSFFIIGIVPVILINGFIYINVLSYLKYDTETELKAVILSKLTEINSYFHKMSNDLKLQTDIDSNIFFFKEFEKAFSESGLLLEKFIKSDKWYEIETRYSSNIKQFYKNNNYYDIYFINNNGDIFYSVNNNINVGTNVFKGELEKTSFSESVKKSIISGDLTVSDYGKYLTSDNNIFGFIINPVFDKNKYQTGIIAFQYSINQMDTIIKSDTIPGKKYNTYLIGPDYTLRSALSFDTGKRILKDKIITDLTKRILNNSFEKNNEIILKYKSINDVDVIGISNTINFGTVKYYIISEIEEKNALQNIYKLKLNIFTVICLISIFTIVFSFIMVRKIIRPILYLSHGVKKVAKGDYSGLASTNLKHEIGEIANSFNEMISFLKSTTEENALQDWFTTGKIELNDLMSGVSDPVELADKIIEFIEIYMNSEQSVLYILENETKLTLLGTYQYSKDKITSYELGQGLIGQSALDKKPIIFKKISENKPNTENETSESIIIYPFISSGEVIGVLEFVISSDVIENTVKFLTNISEDIAVAFKNIISHNFVQELLKKSHNQTLKLEKQQEELKKTNLDLQKKTEALEKSEENLKIQKEELRNINKSLSLQSEELEKQKKEIEIKNIDLEKTKKELELKAKDLEISGKYKSEFLANMSHELRTPLNSIILLSKHLSLNKDGFFDEKQVECIETINSSGNELLNLINDVLDISKVEAGHMKLEYEKTEIKDIITSVERNFHPVAEEKNIKFKTIYSENVPEYITTDIQKLSQILKNLLSNAFKFTEKGSVTLEICQSEKENIGDVLEFKVIDTGLGISDEYKDIVFKAFQQVDGSTSRHHGGTGLGLSISKEFAELFGGDILLESEEGKGSIFILYIPANQPEPELQKTGLKNNKKKTEDIQKEKNDLLKEFYREEYVFKGKKVLVVDDDMRNVFAIINSLEDKKMNTIVAKDGAECLKMLEENPDTDLILIDIIMPVMDGYEAMKRIRKMDSDISNIPVIAITSKAMKGDKMKCINAGANAYLPKPVDIEKLISVMRIWMEQQE